ncbi:hypothetical protein BDF20DRAFT_846768 [Mycotypha africana]|uniref:uncharacterized protein n=1 Tax=Mycotypha africana TaxID=64632 RepID=UPI0023000744|nr:uncharacterized protein BDF20DRAFT_846768 [Mycotypha africana]KAI8991840.1 hypothetical protein BDF20DRAFT_846768 [Mycotypha africana]
MKTNHTSQTLKEIQQIQRSNKCPYRKRNTKQGTSKKRTKTYNNCKYSQACALLEAIKLNGRKRLNDRCVAHISCYIARAWEEKPCQQKVKQIFCMIRNMLEAASMDAALPFDIALQVFCQNPLGSTTICPSTTLLIAMRYVERLKKRYHDVKGSPGCCFRMIIVAFNIALKYMYDCLRLIIYTSMRQLPSANRVVNLITPPSSPKKTTPQNLDANATEVENTKVKANSTAQSTVKPEISIDSQTDTSTCSDVERALKIACLEREFLYCLNYDLSVEDPSSLVTWAHNFDNSPANFNCVRQEYTSADEADDEMEEEDP